MTKKKAAGDQTPPPPSSIGDLRTQSSTLVGKALARLQLEFNDPMIGLAADAGFSNIGIPLPSFAFEYLLLSTVLPVNGRVFMVVGEMGAGKSMLLYEFMRLCYHYCAGHNYLIETEYSKHSYDLLPSIVGWEFSDAVTYMPAADMNQWQARMQAVMRNERIVMDGQSGYSMVPGVEQVQYSRSKQKGSKGQKFVDKTRTKVKKSDYKDDDAPAGRVYPVLVGIDSIMSASMAETCATIEADGFANRAHALEAMSITAFLRKLPVDMYGYPFLVVGINHKKVKPPKPGQHQEERYMPGGRHIGFLESVELECRKIQYLKTTQYEGQRINIKCFKNCLGTTGRDITVDVKWWTEQVDFQGNVGLRQRTVWDWYSASVDLLLDLAQTDVKVRSLIDFVRHDIAGRGTFISSRSLGIPPSEPLSKDKVGARLQATPAVLDPLRDACGIKRYPGFRPWTDFRDQIEVAKKEMRRVEERQQWVGSDGLIADRNGQNQ